MSTVFVVEYSHDCDSSDPIFVADTWEQARAKINEDAARRFPNITDWEWWDDDETTRWPPNVGETTSMEPSSECKARQPSERLLCVQWFITQVDYHAAATDLSVALAAAETRAEVAEFRAAQSEEFERDQSDKITLLHAYCALAREQIGEERWAEIEAGLEAVPVEQARQVIREAAHARYSTDEVIQRAARALWARESDLPWTVLRPGERVARLGTARAMIDAIFQHEGTQDGPASDV